jgi:hypothetical protein
VKIKHRVQGGGWIGSCAWPFARFVRPSFIWYTLSNLYLSNLYFSVSHQNHFEMGCFLLFAILTVLAFISTGASSNFPPIWPYPAKFTNGSASILVDSLNFKFFSNLAQTDCIDIYNAFSRFSPIFFPHAQSRKSVASSLSESTLTGVCVNILNCSVPLQLGVDESYSLEVYAGGGYVSFCANFYTVVQFA